LRFIAPSGGLERAGQLELKAGGFEGTPQLSLPLDRLLQLTDGLRRLSLNQRLQCSSWRSPTSSTPLPGLACSSVPHSEQKVAEAGCSAPQPGQASRSGAPHSLQNRAPGACSAPQEGQAVAPRRV
jgi:hypothetical protein